MKRRTFIKSAIGGLGMMSLASLVDLKAFAAEEGRFFVSIWLQDGMDVPVGLDPWFGPGRADAPKPTDLFLGYGSSDILSNAEIYLGPAAAPLKKWSSEISVINGVIVSNIDVGHTAAKDYIATGKMDGSLAQLTIELSNFDKNKSVLTNMSMSVGTTSVSLYLPNNFSNPMQIDEEVLLLIDDGGDSAIAAAQKEILRKLEIEKKLRKKLTDLQVTFDGKSDHIILAQSLLHGLVSGGHLSLRGDGNTDAHSGYAKQGSSHIEAQKSAWEKVAQVFEYFKSVDYGAGESLFDRTTFMVFTEFSRTPFLNAAEGKDHNPKTNSVLIAGRGIRSGLTLGQSQVITREQTGNISYHMGTPFDFENEKPVFVDQPGLTFIRPENVAKTIALAAGIPKIHVDLMYGKDTKILKSLIK